MPSIKQNPAAHPLPDCRNLGVMLRILLGANLAALMAALILDSPGTWRGWGEALLGVSAWVELPLLVLLGLLALGRDLLWRLPPPAAQGVVLAGAALVAAVQYDSGASWACGRSGHLRGMLLAMALCGGLLAILPCAPGLFPAVARLGSGPDRPHPSPFPLQQPECGALPDP